MGTVRFRPWGGRRNVLGIQDNDFSAAGRDRRRAAQCRPRPGHIRSIFGNVAHDTPSSGLPQCDYSTVLLRNVKTI
jgi:hypothetical protein